MPSKNKSSRNDFSYSGKPGKTSHDNTAEEDELVVDSWYLVKASAGQEFLAKSRIEAAAKERKCLDKILEFVIPYAEFPMSEKTRRGKAGKSSNLELESLDAPLKLEKLGQMSGYFAVHLLMTSAMKAAIKQVTDSHPIIFVREKSDFAKLSSLEVTSMRREFVSVKLYNYSVGDRVIINSDTLQNVSGSVKSVSIEDQTVVVTVPILGWSTDIVVPLDKTKPDEE